MYCRYDNVPSRRTFCLKLASLSCAGIISMPALAACFADSSSSGNNTNSTSDMSDNNKKNMQDGFEPGYLKLHRTGELRARAEVMWDMMKACRLCPRECEKDRIRGQKGEYCSATSQLRVSSFNPHFGEEKPLVGRNGSGTIFFTNCALLCVFCINWEISQGGVGQNIEIRQLSNIMLQLQKMGCHNINMVTPTHYSPHILLALDDAASRGLRLPLVYNTSGWERMEILNLLDGVVDIYLSDFKFFEPEKANIYSPGAVTYPEDTKKAVLEMNRQVGVADPAANQGLLRRGLIIRHLVMPNNAGGTDALLGWIASNLPKNTYVNLMSQYRPAFKASEFPEISRGLQIREYRKAIETAVKAGLTNLDIQGNH
jgi:putative pyruvate formate lyase activating enzyme